MPPKSTGNLSSHTIYIHPNYKELTFANRSLLNPPKSRFQFNNLTLKMLPQPSSEIIYVPPRETPTIYLPPKVGDFYGQLFKKGGKILKCRRGSDNLDAIGSEIKFNPAPALDLTQLLSVLGGTDLVAAERQRSIDAAKQVSFKPIQQSHISYNVDNINRGLQKAKEPLLTRQINTSDQFLNEAFKADNAYNMSNLEHQANTDISNNILTTDRQNQQIDNYNQSQEVTMANERSKHFAKINEAKHLAEASRIENKISNIGK